MKHNLTTTEMQQYQHNRLVEFRLDLSRYNVPEGFRVWEGVDLYKQARMELYGYFNDGMTLDEINHTDCALRNVMKLWPIDKLHMQRK